MRPIRNRYAMCLVLVALLPQADLRGQSENRLQLTGASCPPGENVEVYIIADNMEPLAGLEVSLYFAEGITLDALDLEGCDLPSSAKVYGPVEGEGCISFGIITDFSSENLVLPLGEGHKVARLLVRAPETAEPGGEFAIEIADGCGEQEVRNLFAVSEGLTVRKVYPELSSGLVSISEPGDCNQNGIPDGQEITETPSLDANSDGILDVCQLQHPGDCNQDGAVDISDAVCLLKHLFLGGPESQPCGEGAAAEEGTASLLDFNGDSGLDLSDAVYLLNWLFLGSRKAHVLGTECVPIAGCGPSPACR